MFEEVKYLLNEKDHFVHKYDHRGSNTFQIKLCERICLSRPLAETSLLLNLSG